MLARKRKYVCGSKHSQANYKIYFTSRTEKGHLFLIFNFVLQQYRSFAKYMAYHAKYFNWKLSGGCDWKLHNDIIPQTVLSFGTYLRVVLDIHIIYILYHTPLCEVFCKHTIFTILLYFIYFYPILRCPNFSWYLRNALLMNCACIWKLE